MGVVAKPPTAAQLRAREAFARKYGGKRATTGNRTVAKTASPKTSNRRVFGVNLMAVGKTAGGAAAAQVIQEALPGQLGDLAEGVAEVAAGGLLKDPWLQHMGGYHVGQRLIGGGASILKGGKKSKKAPTKRASSVRRRR